MIKTKFQDILVVKSHSHCCGGYSLKGLNSSRNWTPTDFLLSLYSEAKGAFQPVARPVGRASSYGGVGFFNMVVAYWPSTDPDSMYGYSNVESLRALKRYVEANGLGSVTLAPRTHNDNYEYNTRWLYPAVFVPNKPELYGWLKHHTDDVDEHLRFI